MAGPLRSLAAVYEEAWKTHLQTIHPDFWDWRQSKRPFGVALGLIAGGLTAIGLTYYTAFVLHFQNAYWYVAISIACLVAIVVPPGLIIRRGTEHFRAEWKAEGKIATPTRTVGADLLAGPIADDRSIVALTEQLSSQLHIPSLTIAGVAWQSLILQPVRLGRGGGDIRVHSDRPVFREPKLYLAHSMQGKLSLDEWRPLIASVMIDDRKLRPRKIRMGLLMLIPIAAAYVAGWVLIPPLFPTSTTCTNDICTQQNTGLTIVSIALVALPLLVIAVGVIVLNRFTHVADEETARIFGKDQLISSLQRVVEVDPARTHGVRKRIEALKRMDITGR